MDSADKSGTANTTDWTPWVYLALEWGKQHGRMRGCPLLLTLSFGMHHLKVLGGRVWFGLSGGVLDITPIGGSFLIERFWPKNTLEPSVSVQRTLRAERRDTQNRSMGVKASLEGPNATANLSSKQDAVIANSIEEVLEHMHLRVIVHGAPSRALWTFATAPGELYLAGRLTRREIARLKMGQGRSGLKAAFSVFKKDIRVLFAQGLWPENVSENKHRVLMRLLRKFVADQMGQTVCLLELPPADEEANDE